MFDLLLFRKNYIDKNINVLSHLYSSNFTLALVTKNTTPHTHSALQHTIITRQCYYLESSALREARHMEHLGLLTRRNLYR